MPIRFLSFRSVALQKLNLYVQHRNDLHIHCAGLFTVLAQVKATSQKNKSPAGRMKVARQVLPGKVKSNRRVPPGTAEIPFAIGVPASMNTTSSLTQEKHHAKTSSRKHEDAPQAACFRRRIDFSRP